MENDFIPEKCDWCKIETQSMISVKDGKRCRYAARAEYDIFGPLNCCSLLVVAKCGHQTSSLKHSEGCISAKKCPDFEKKSWWMTEPQPVSQIQSGP